MCIEGGGDAGGADGVSFVCRQARARKISELEFRALAEGNAVTMVVEVV